MFHLFSSMSTSPHMYSDTRSRSGTVGNGSYWQSEAFLLGVAGSVLGLAVMYTLSLLSACRIFKGKKKGGRLCTFKNTLVPVPENWYNCKNHICRNDVLFRFIQCLMRPKTLADHCL